MTEELTEWCMGLPLTQRRELDEAERQKLQRQVNFLHGCGIGLLLLYPALAAFVCIVAWATSMSVEETKAALVVGGILVSVVILPVLLLSVRDILHRRRALLSDLSAQSVKRFAGVFTPGAGGEDFAKKLRRACFAPDKTTGEWSIEVLAASGRVWRVQDQPVKAWMNAPIMELARTPEMASIAAQWLQPVPLPTPDKVMGGQREMSPAEREELRRYARRLWLRPLPVAIGLTLWAGIPLSLQLFSHHAANRKSSVPFSILVGLAALTDAQFVTALRLSRRMQRDGQIGRVAIVRVEHSDPARPAGPVIEILPLARREWTRAGQPASWRMSDAPR